MELAAFIIALLALALAVRVDLRQRRAERREVRQEERGEQQAQRDEAEASARRRGEPSVVSAGGSGGPGARFVEHHFDVRNVGQATMRKVWLWLEDDAEEEPVSGRAGPITLTPDDSPARMTIQAWAPFHARQTLWIRWTDGEGSTRSRPTSSLPLTCKPLRGTMWGTLATC